jgi:hypothetical protein
MISITDAQVQDLLWEIDFAHGVAKKMYEWCVWTTVGNICG